MFRRFRTRSYPAIALAAGLGLGMYVPCCFAGNHGHVTNYQVVQGYILQSQAVTPAAQPTHASGQGVSAPAPSVTSPPPVAAPSTPVQIQWVSTPAPAVQMVQVAAAPVVQAVQVQMVQVPTVQIAAAPAVQIMQVQSGTVAIPVQLLIPTKHKWHHFWGK